MASAEPCASPSTYDVLRSALHDERCEIDDLANRLSDSNHLAIACVPDEACKSVALRLVCCEFPVDCVEKSGSFSCIQLVPEKDPLHIAVHSKVYPLRHLDGGLCRTFEQFAGVVRSRKVPRYSMTDVTVVRNSNAGWGTDQEAQKGLTWHVEGTGKPTSDA